MCADCRSCSPLSAASEPLLFDVEKAGRSGTCRRTKVPTFDGWPANNQLGDCWMSRLPDEALLSSLTIPGTHDSAAYTSPWPFIATQTLNITQQLDSGIRYFDLRCGLRNDELEMVHGPTYLGLKLAEVFGVLYRWLDAHPRECLIVQIKKDRNAERSTKRFSDSVREQIMATSDRWSVAHVTLTLGELRGRIQLFRRFTSAARSPLGIDVTPWQDNPSSPFTIYNGSRTQLTIQDHYSFTDPEPLGSLIVSKGRDVADLLARSSSDPEPSHWYINFTSAYEFNLSYQIAPRTVAVGGYAGFKWEPGMNPRLEVYLDQRGGQKRYGIVVMDFPERGSEDLIGSLILSNFERLDLIDRTRWLVRLLAGVMMTLSAIAVIVLRSRYENAS